MKNLKSSILFVFFGSMLILSAILFLFPINLFDGIIVIENGLQRVELNRPLSLSYFIGIGYEEADMEFVKDFYLTTRGYLLAGIFLVGIPGLIAYRVYLKRRLE